MDEDEFGGDWILEALPCNELTVQRPSQRGPLIDATWRGGPVAVVAPGVIAEWRATTQAAFFSTTNLNAQAVDLPATFAAEGLTGPLPRNALVVKNCAGIQIGNGNSQTNIHKFRVEDVRITLDKALTRRLAASVPASPLATGRTKVSLWNSRGVQVGDFNRQRNVFRHVVKGPEIPLKLRDSGIVDKLRDGQVAAAERALLTIVRRELKRDAEPLYASLDVTCNENRPVPPKVLKDTVASAYGHSNEQRNREHFDVRKPEPSWPAGCLGRTPARARSVEGAPGGARSDEIPVATPTHTSTVGAPATGWPKPGFVLLARPQTAFTCTDEVSAGATPVSVVPAGNLIRAGDRGPLAAMYRSSCDLALSPIRTA